MIKLPRRLLFVCCTLLFHLLVTANPVDDSVVEGLSVTDLINRIRELRTEDSEKALELCEKGLEFYGAKKDTLSCINLLIAESKVYGHKAQYQTSYDRNWKAYLLANESNNKVALIDTKLSIGRYYSFYKRKDEAFQYLKEALAINKELMSEGKVEESSLVRNYYLIAKTHRELSNPTLAKIYLDSCYLYGAIKNLQLSSHIGVEEAILSGDPQEGIEKLNKLLPELAKSNKGYQVLVYKYIGDKYLELGKTAEAEQSLLKSLDLSSEYKSHLDFSPLVYQSLSQVYAQTGQHEDAYKAILAEKNLDELYFDSRSENNRSLLFIRDKFQEELEQRDKLLQQQKVDKLEIEEKEAILKNILLTIILIFSLFCGALYFAHIKSKHRNEKRLLKKKKELEVAHANEMLELKNRELALSSLKLIEKDELLSSLKERLASSKGDIKRDDLKKIVRTISHSNSHNWEEFETRFTSVNRDFYSKLNKKYPKLTRGDQKLCALIKLNLSSKEMAKLLGISIESVHTNRYRLRKKLTLTKETSLTEFVARL